MKTYLSVKQAVVLLNNAVSAKLLYSLIARGKLVVNRTLGKILIEEESLLRLMEPVPAPIETPPPPRRPRGRPKKPLDDLW